MQTKPTQTAKKPTGRPSSGVPRKEQIRRAVRSRRLNNAAASMSIEIPYGLSWAIKKIASRDKISVKEAATRLLEDAWRTDYIATGGHPATANAQTTSWRKAMDKGYAK